MPEDEEEHIRWGAHVPGGILKTWSSTQASIAQSSGEAEYYALVRAASESLGMQSLMRDMGWDAKIRLLVDSSAAKSIASRKGLGKLRHPEIKFLWLQEAVRKKKVVLGKVRGGVNPVDVLTKPKSLDDMKQLLDFSCIDWCDSAHANDVNHFCIDGRTFRPRGVLGNGYHIQGPITHGPMGLVPMFLGRASVGARAATAAIARQLQQQAFAYLWLKSLT